MSDNVNMGGVPALDAKRDAVHVAVVPLIAGNDQLDRGHYFKLKNGTTGVALPAKTKDGALGIVDPFLPPHTYLYRGDRFWGFLFPNTVTGMQHHWFHPAFDLTPVATDVNEHEQWIREFADNWNFDYDELIAAAQMNTNRKYDRYVVAQGRDLHGAEELGGDHDLFWEHLEAMTGRKYDEEHREGMGWSCSC